MLRPSCTAFSTAAHAQDRRDFLVRPMPQPAAGRFFGPDQKFRQSVGSETVRQRHVGSVAAIGDKDAADTRRIVAWIEDMPVPTEINFDPGGKIHCLIRRWQADVSDVAGAIARRNIEAAAERRGEMCKVAAHALALVIGLVRRPRRARILVAEIHDVVDVIADCLHTRPARRHIAEEAPGFVRQPIGLAIAAGEQELQRLGGKLLDRMLDGSRERPAIPFAGIVDDRIGQNLEMAGRREEAIAPIAETIAIAFERDTRARDDIIRLFEIGCARIMHIEHDDHRRRLREFKIEVATNFDADHGTFLRERARAGKTQSKSHAGPGQTLGLALSSALTFGEGRRRAHFSRSGRGSACISCLSRTGRVHCGRPCPRSKGRSAPAAPAPRFAAPAVAARPELAPAAAARRREASAPP